MRQLMADSGAQRAVVDVGGEVRAELGRLGVEEGDDDGVPTGNVERVDPGGEGRLYRPEVLGA